MKTIFSTTLMAGMLALSAAPAMADDLVGTFGKGKGGRHTVALDLVTTGNSSAFEFVVALPKGATNVDVSQCMKSLPASHSAQCVYNAETNEVIGIAFSSTNAKLAQDAISLGSVTYSAPRKGGQKATLRGLVVGNDRGEEIPSNIQTDEALLGK